VKKILLIEDDNILRENTAEILMLYGHDVKTAANGRIGVEKAIAEKPDLIICDIMMPELDGYGVLHILSQNSTTNSIPFIFLSAKTERSEVRKGMDLGADDYLTKPFEDSELMNAIESRLKKRDKLSKKLNPDISGINEVITNFNEIIEIEAIQKIKKPIKLKKKEIIFREGDTPSFVYFIEKGKVKVFKTNEEGKDFGTNFLGAGDFFGFSSILEESAYKETAMTSEESHIVRLPKADFLKIILGSRDISYQFIKLLSANVEEKEKKLISLAFDSVRKRTASTLYQLIDKYKDNLINGNVAIKISRDDLASLVGTATETVIRSIADLKEDGIVALEARQIIILDQDRLKNINY